MGDPTQDYVPSKPFFDFQYKLDPAFYPTRAEPSRFKLLDQHLRLDPDFLASFQRLEADLASDAVLAAILRPNWSLLEKVWGDYLEKAAPDPFGLKVPTPSTPANNPAAGPQPPRAAHMSDLLDALSKEPHVQGFMRNARDEGLRQYRVLKQEWSGAPLPEKIAMVSVGGIVAGGFIGEILAAKPTRDLTFRFLDGRDIPTPVEGFSLQFLAADDAKKRGYGGGVGFPLPLPGLTGGASVQARPQAFPDLSVTVRFDLMKFWKARQKP